ncbi:MAG: AAA family ATPase [Marinibacterium sp.]|nr:AAA family ATPase [Marinibacterium sp.]
MTTIPGFRLSDRIYKSDNSIVFRATRDHDGMPVVLKILKNDFPSMEDLARYRREYDIVDDLDHIGVVTPYELRRHDKTLLMVLEDFGGMSVARLLRDRPMSIDETLDAAIQVVQTLDHVHGANVIHKDLSPQNIVVNPATGEVKLIDFGISTRFSSERPELRNPEVLEGTLAYMSPEQTGRMNRSLDYRTDYYSLGATLYEMLTGSAPFEADDLMELVHCHIAREPMPAYRRNPDVPLALSKVVSKLMAKKAEDRYQSARGILSDLDAIRKGAASDRFEPGLNDQSDRFQIPERLYGRDEEVTRLLETFERTRHGQAELLLVAGYSGVGKSALVNEVHKPITRARGVFISGKYDQYQRNTPFSGLIAALRDLVRQLLTESEDVLDTVRNDLTEALSPIGQVMIDLLPELELIIGPQPPVPDLDGAQAMARFRRTIGQFLRALVRRDKVIVLFLDDLQWADTASLGLLHHVLTDDDMKRLLVIGAYRDQEVDAMHPLRMTLSDIEDAGGQVRTLTLAPLGLTDLGRLLTDTLHSDAAELTGLARMVLQKTQGNPLFVRQFLMDLHREGVINQAPATAFDRARWQWDDDALRAMGITENVVDLLLRRLRLLGEDTQEALQFAACIGGRFDIETLALMLKLPLSDAFERLRPAIEDELLRTGSHLTTAEADDAMSPLIARDLVFQHDRVQQAAYSLIPDDRRAGLHLDIGRRLQSTLSLDALQERIFEVVDHFNMGRALVHEADERLLVAQLNLQAAQRASDATAYAAALDMVLIAETLLGDTGWDDSYELRREASQLRISLEYLNGNYDTCSAVVTETLDHVRTDLERAEIYFTRIAQHTMLAEFQEAVDAAYKSLELVGVVLPQDNLDAASQQIIGEVTGMLNDSDPATLFDLPECTQPEALLAQRTLRHLTIAAFLFNQALWPVVVGTSVKLSLDHGNAPESPLSYANYGLILGSVMQNFKRGAEFGDLALRLCDHYEGRAPNATVCLVVGAELVPWVQHVREAIPVVDRGIHEGLDSGEILWVGYLSLYRVLLESFSGARLNEILERIPERLEFNEQIQNFGAVAGIRAHQIALCELAGIDAGDALAPSMDEATFLAGCEDNNLMMAVCIFKILKAQTLYLLGRPADALEATRDIDDKLSFIVNHPNLADHRLYQSLSLAALYPSGDAVKDAGTLAQLQGNLAQLRLWAENCPENYLSKCLLVEAEIARISGQGTQASDLYDRAIEAAHDSHILQDEALANELAARFVRQARPKSRVGAMYLRDAHYAYRMWGAGKKVEELEMEFPQLLSEYREMRALPNATLDLTRTTLQSKQTQSNAVNIDMDTLIKAGQTISGEVVFGRLLDRLLSIVIENAGAQRALLLLGRGGKLYVEAEANVTWTESNVMMSLPIDQDDGAALVPLGVVNYATRTHETIVLDEAKDDERFLNDPYISRRETRSMLCQPIVNQGELVGLIYLENDLTSGAFTPERAHLVALLSGQIAISIRNAELVENLEDKVRERTAQLEMHSRFIEQTFGRYLSSQIVDRLLKSPDGLDFRGRNAPVTILSTDLRGFTAFSDSLPPETIVKLLNNYLSEMTTVIEKYNGTIDAFVGDSILIMFGVPFQRADDAERAVACALEMQLQMPRINAWNAENGLPELDMGIGINTGEVVVGNIGSHKRAKFGVVGRNVNLAARVEGYTVGGQILITDSTRQAVSEPMSLRDYGVVEPKGVSEPVRLFDLQGLGGRHDLSLPDPQIGWIEMTPAMQAEIRLVVDKKVVGDPRKVTVTRLSPEGVEILCDEAIEVSTDLMIDLPLGPDGAMLTGIYGKVVEAGDSLHLRFTALPGDARAALRALDPMAEAG